MHSQITLGESRAAMHCATRATLAWIFSWELLKLFGVLCPLISSRELLATLESACQVYTMYSALHIADLKMTAHCSERVCNC